MNSIDSRFRLKITYGGYPGVNFHFRAKYIHTLLFFISHPFLIQIYLMFLTVCHNSISF